MGTRFIHTSDEIPPHRVRPPRHQVGPTASCRGADEPEIRLRSGCQTAAAARMVCGLRRSCLGRRGAVTSVMNPQNLDATVSACLSHVVRAVAARSTQHGRGRLTGGQLCRWCRRSSGRRGSGCRGRFRRRRRPCGDVSACCGPSSLPCSSATLPAASRCTPLSTPARGTRGGAVPRVHELHALGSPGSTAPIPAKPRQEIARRSALLRRCGGQDDAASASVARPAMDDCLCFKGLVVQDHSGHP